MTEIELQAFRMSTLWPLVVGCAAFLLARAVFWFASPALRRDQGIACVVVGVAGAVVALAIAVGWDNSLGYWFWFTTGMAVLAVILIVTVVQLAVEMWRR